MNDNLYQDSNNTNQITTQQVPTNSQGGNFELTLLEPLLPLLIFAGAIVLLYLLVYGLLLYIRHQKHNNKIISDWKQSVILEITVPKESAEQIQKEGTNKREDKDFIAVGEQIFRVMSEYSTGGFKYWMNGGERFSLEIISLEREIRFWMVCREKIASVIEQQITAVYPKANIDRIKGDKIFNSDMSIYTQELKIANRYELPFKTYRDIDQDPLNSLTNTMASVGKGEIASVQLVLTPVNDKWQSKPRILASKIQQGQSPKQVLFPETNTWKIIFSNINKFIDSIILRSPKKEDELKPKKRKIDLTGEEQAINLTPQQQEFIKKLEEKASKPGFYYSLRVVGIAPDSQRAKQIVENITPVFQIYDTRPLNWIKKDKSDVKTSVLNYLLRGMQRRHNQIMNTEEVNSIWHIPSYLVQTPTIKWLLARKPPIPLNLPEKDENTTFLGYASSRGQKRDVFMRLDDRYRHVYSIGGSGSGKTYLMTNIIVQDIRAGRGVCVVDPHGEGVDDVLQYIPPERYDDVIIFSPSITDRPLGLNMLEYDPLKPTQKTLVTDTLFTIWDKLYNLKQTGGPMFEMYMKNSMRLVMSHPESGCTLMEIPKVLSDEDFRSFKLAMCNETEVIDFWEKEATKAGGEASLENMVPYITSKLAPFITNDFIRPMIGQQKSAINFRQAMDNNKIVLVKLEKGLIGETSAYLVGMVVVGGLLMAGMGRNDGLRYNLDGTTEIITKDQRRPFFVYIDEMQNFLFDAIPKALEEIRKYKVGFYLAHQFVKQVIDQGNERIKDSIMANCGTKLIFRVGADDAQYLEKEFSPTLTGQDLMTPEAFTANVILLANGTKTTPFNLKPSTWPTDGNPDAKRILTEMTKQKYGRDKAEVEKEIRDRAKLPF